MEYNDAITLLKEMKSRFNDGFSSSDRDVLESLHRLLFNRGITNKGCSDCYRDAYIEIYNRLKTSKEMPKLKSNYTLKAGAIIRRAGDNRFYANPLPNDEIPEQYLADFPGEIDKFATYPADWERRVALRKEGNVPEGELSQEEAQNIIGGLQADLNAKNEELSALRAEYEALRAATEEAGASDEVANLKLEIAALTADLNAANAEAAELRAENETLKAKKKTTKKTDAE